MAAQPVGHSAARLLDAVGPLLVGLRTLEWRWDRLADAGVDRDDLLAGLADRAVGVAKVAAELPYGAVAHGSAALAALVTGIADRAVPGPRRRPAELGAAVEIASDLHRELEQLRSVPRRDAGRGV